MIGKKAAFGSLAWLLAATLAVGEEKLELKLDKGSAVRFAVKRESTTEGTGQQGEFSTKSTSEIVYRIESQGKNDKGDLVLKVTYDSLKVKSDGRDGGWEFDSARKEGGDEAADAIRESIGKSITVTISNGRIADLAGFPERQRPADGERPNFRRLRGARYAGDQAMRGDLELILASAVQGKGLEKDKVYTAERERPQEGAPGDDQGRRRARQGGGRGGFGGGFFGFGGERVSFKYGGEEKAGDHAAAKFEIMAAPAPDRPNAPEGRPEVKASTSGTALASRADGLLLKLEISSDRETKGERNGQTFRFASKSKVMISREAAGKAEKKAEKKVEL
jgi:hypothetical protein